MRNKLKEFIAKHGLTIPYLHRQTGIHKDTLNKLIKTNDPIKPFVLLKLETKLSEIGFSRLDLETFKMLVNKEFITNCEDGVNFTIESKRCDSFIVFKLTDITSITYDTTIHSGLFCEVLFKSGSRLILNDNDMEVFI